MTTTAGRCDGHGGRGSLDSLPIKKLANHAKMFHLIKQKSHVVTGHESRIVVQICKTCQ